MNVVCGIFVFFQYGGAGAGACSAQGRGGIHSSARECWRGAVFASERCKESCPVVLPDRLQEREPAHDGARDSEHHFVSSNYGADDCGAQQNEAGRKSAEASGELCRSPLRNQSSFYAGYWSKSWEPQRMQRAGGQHQDGRTDDAQPQMLRAKSKWNGSDGGGCKQHCEPCSPPEDCIGPVRDGGACLTHEVGSGRVVHGNRLRRPVRVVERTQRKHQRCNAQGCRHPRDAGAKFGAIPEVRNG